MLGRCVCKYFKEYIETLEGLRINLFFTVEATPKIFSQFLFPTIGNRHGLQIHENSWYWLFSLICAIQEFGLVVERPSVIQHSNTDSQNVSIPDLHQDR